MSTETTPPQTLHRGTTERGELVLRRAAGPAGDGDHFEIISNGVFLMDTRDGGSERALVREALAAVTDTAGDGVSVLVGGLGVGFSLLEALACPAVRDVTVVEIEPDIVSWHSTHLAGVTRGALDDPRVRLVVDDAYAALGADPRRYHAICMDVDNGPGWTVTEHNRRLYDERGLDLLRSRLEPAGVLAVWSAHDDPEFHQLLSAPFGGCRVVEVPTATGVPDRIYLARRQD